ncbi:MAG: autotransporter outer membrane beta-barrel domain-containing protein [Opitutales bacterium]|nr:autotransporter outer membrane beta-barrel domain-containing protein [Opitutales bacterium]
MKKFLFVVLASVSCVSFLHSEENLNKPHTIVALGKYNKPKHTTYEIGSVGGTRFVHNRIYEKGGSTRYGCRSVESVTGLWTKVKIAPVMLNACVAYTYDTHKYDRMVGVSDSAHGKFHGYSLSTIIEAQYNPVKVKSFKVSPFVGLRYKYSHKRAYTERNSSANRSYEKSDLKSLRLGIGVFLEKNLRIFSRKCWIYSKLTYLHVLHDSDPTVKYTIGNGAIQSERSNFQKKDGFEMELGTAINFFRKWDADVCYQLFADDKLSSHGVLWRVSYNF